MPNPTFSANGSVILPLLSGRIYTIGVGGDFGGGSLAANLLLDDDTPVPVTGFPIIAPADKTFTGTTTRLQLTLSGATSPALTYAVTLATGNSPESIGAATPASVADQLEAAIDELTENIITDTTTARTYALADSGQYIRCTNAGAITHTIPTNATVAFPVGSEIYVRRTTGAGVVTVGGGGVTINNNLSADVPAGGVFALKKIATDNWDFI